MSEKLRHWLVFVRVIHSMIRGNGEGVGLPALHLYIFYTKGTHRRLSYYVTVNLSVDKSRKDVLTCNI